ncbi:hypothetical protein J056_002200 [Wallemia ichthyophaga EXF-994]|uniref:BHLH domain-containing protein n=1 Tax=Wallemia ichthyophaga (strain EXF-994 / CBS 113033) TaxID=1299270 RepID=R9APH0_WALI9|nr:uncharacterized protein J056_002200 [Wallemia ichthyophaga EXF-994]EOR04122.1 hypothetical protein J056_002200 [Wallemia ichthyophaga EXF-994]TIA76142.1 hypothetical protein E3P91_00065 [Wallemia ichthyophaga]TIB37714.1 hypothetical protein E3P84_00066 [Wallemia ichthyophaga]TIB44610.1 hypothetical protein E3P83_00066 [Wallemia ichthyophaga]
MPPSGFFMPSNPLSSSIPKIRQEGGFNSPQESQPQEHQQQQPHAHATHPSNGSVHSHSHSWRDLHSSFDISDTLDSLMQTESTNNQWMQTDPFANFNNQQQQQQQQQQQHRPPQPPPHHHLQHPPQPPSPLINFQRQNPYDNQSNSPASDDMGFESPHLSSQPYPRRNSMVRENSHSRSRATSNASGVGKAPSSRSRSSRASISGPAPHLNTPQSQSSTPVPAQAIFIPSSAPATQPWGHSFPGTGAGTAPPPVPQPNSSMNNESNGQRRMSVDYGATPSSLGQDNSLRDDDAKSGESLTERRRRRRESHNAVERRRRDNINERIAELATLLPEELLADVGPPNSRSNKQSQTPSQGHQLLEPISPRHPDQLPSSFSGRLETLDETQVANLQPGQSPTSAQQQQQQSQQKQQAVAAAAAGKPNKGVILRKSVDYIRYLQQVVDAQTIAQKEMQAELDYYRKIHPQSVNAAQTAIREGNTTDSSSPQGLLLQFDKNANQREPSASAVSASVVSDGSEDYSHPPPPPLQPLVKHEDIRIEDMNSFDDYGLGFGQYDFNIHNQQHNQIQSAMEQ